MASIVAITGNTKWMYDNSFSHTFKEVCTITVKENNAYTEFTTPIGFTTDFCSAGIFKVFFNDKSFKIASVVHDLCYRYQLRSFDDSNKLFISILYDLGCKKWKIKVCMIALSTPIARNRYNQYKVV
jgi:hypothetical protein